MMELSRSPESNFSLISLDPAIARVIRPFDPSITNHDYLSAQNAHRLEVEALQKPPPRARPPSLKRVKNSNEVLRQRSVRAQQEAATANVTTTNSGGRNFTVGSVGTGGKLFLRPSANQAQRNPSPPLMPAPLLSESSFSDQLEQEETYDEKEGSNWPRSNASDQSGSLKAGSSAATKNQKWAGPPKSSAHSRAFSFSTGRETGQLSSEAQNGVFRVVIDRAAAIRPKTAEHPSLPNLEVSIPHYRLGKPQFDTEGGAGLHSSIYTHNSEGMPDFSRLGIGNHDSTIGHGTVGGEIPGRKVAAQTTVRDLTGNKQTPGPVRAATYQPIHHDPKQAISPKVFDNLAAIEDDASIVRYSQKNGAITAATPARIVAQISSESFMDYELVSDFFLTFRTFLSTEHLLNLLLARLHWAINRLEEDGRIIRIRTFAALRHWILNYFVDDFLVDRKIRVQFCKQINEMYQEISKRTGFGVSDLKILLDLKRCWNGRCSLYWDSPDSAFDARPEAEVLPGGVLGSRDPTLTDIDLIVDQNSNSLPTNLRERANLARAWYEKNDQQEFAETPTLRAKKIQALASCPPMSAPNPSRRVSHAHRRAASTSDSVRNTGVGLAEPPSIVMIDPHAGSLVRGNVFPPSAPFVDVIAPGSPPDQTSRSHVGAPGFSTYLGGSNRPGPSANPNPKSLMGSIRRALSSRQTVIPPASSNQDPFPVLSSSRSKTSVLPFSTTKSTDTLKEKRASPSTRHTLRIDLLCAAVSQSYQIAQNRIKEDTLVNPGLGVSLPDQADKKSSVRSVGSRNFSLEAGDMQRILSHDGELVNSALENIDNNDDTSWPNSDLPRYSREQPHVSQGASAMSELAVGGMASMPHLSQEHSTNERRQNLSSSRRSSSVDSALTRRVNEGRRAQRTSSQRIVRSKSAASGILRGYIGPRRISDATLTADSEINLKSRGPPHTLRRRPGGDLRATENVQDLAPAPRESSFGSLATTPDSIGSMLMIASKQGANKKATTPAAQPINKPVSLIRTDSAKQLRPSFEAAISGFSTIPDDEDGGLEATLLKLEGKYDKTSPPMVSKPKFTQTARVLPATAQNESNRPGQPDSDLKEKKGNVQQPIDQSKSDTIGSKSIMSTKSKKSYSSAGLSNSSYSSIPLLERGLTDDSLRRQKTATPSVKPDSELAPPVPNQDVSGSRKASPSDPSTEAVDKRERSGDPGSSPTLLRPRPSTTQGSFLLDEDDDLTDLSSEISVDIMDDSQGRPVYLSSMDGATGTAAPGSEMPSHPLAHPPSPAFSFHHAVASDSPVDPMQYQQKPLTPQPSPTQVEPIQSIPMTILGVMPRSDTAAEACFAMGSNAGHIPFMLACESEKLAQQLTIVEKAALNEVDWTDLVDMKWDNKSPTYLNWVEYLATGDHRGIDLVITRFNLVVKWVLSEILMTQDIYERARVITKYVHVAAHAKRMHNYATMLQITIALTSVDCTRLKGTWDLVPDEETRSLQKMEVLIQPIRNFHDLRVEMETANLQHGCIPFLGLYIHDLTFNSQKPSEIAGSHGGEPLINFEKHRTTATIVKSLLRLIDASTQYNFVPLQGVIEPCLWLAALSDDKIAYLSKNLE